MSPNTTTTRCEKMLVLVELRYTSHNDANHAATVLTLMSKRHALLLLVWIVLKAGGVSEMRLQFNNDESSANALATH